MQISGVSAAIQSYILSFEKQQSKSSTAPYATTQAAAGSSQQSAPATSATTQAAAASNQESTAAASANQGRYLSGAMGIAALLSSQGATVTEPNLQQFINPSDIRPGSGTATGVVGPPATASYVASQIIEGVGSNGVLTLAEVENAENGTTGALTSNSNSDADIAADFEKMSGGATTMTAAQLASAIQSYMETQP